MTVSELIENLQQLQQDLPVVVYDADFCQYYPVVLAEFEKVVLRQNEESKIEMIADYNDGLPSIPVIRLFTNDKDV